MNLSIETWAQLAIALFTGLAAGGALWAAKTSSDSARESSAIAAQQSEAQLTATRANTLASRIDFCSRQLTTLQAAGGNQNQLAEYQLQQQHLAAQLDQQLEKLGVGILQFVPGAPTNNEVPRWKTQTENRRTQGLFPSPGPRVNP